MVPPVKLSIGGKRVVVKPPSGAYARKKPVRKKQALSKPAKREVKNLITAAQNKAQEFKYTSIGLYSYNGTIANAQASFYRDNTGMIKTATPTIAVGDGHNQRIGTSVDLKRVLCQFVLKWPLAADTPNWNARGNTYVDMGTRSLRTTLPVRVHLVQFHFADGSFADLEHYMAGFKRMYTLQENMTPGGKSLIKQEVKILGTRKVTLRRRLVEFDAGGNPQYHYQPVEGVINHQFTKGNRLMFNNAAQGGSQTMPMNYRYGVIVQFGHLEDQFINIDEKYNPQLRFKVNYWYTDA